jgi:hypothetical protein
MSSHSPPPSLSRARFTGRRRRPVRAAPNLLPHPRGRGRHAGVARRRRRDGPRSSRLPRAVRPQKPGHRRPRTGLRAAWHRLLGQRHLRNRRQSAWHRPPGHRRPRNLQLARPQPGRGRRSLLSASPGHPLPLHRHPWSVFPPREGPPPP